MTRHKNRALPLPVGNARPRSGTSIEVGRGTFQTVAQGTLGNFNALANSGVSTASSGFIAGILNPWEFRMVFGETVECHDSVRKGWLLCEVVTGAHSAVDYCV